MAKPASRTAATAPISHYIELDGMRGVLACGVMAFHLGLNTLIAQLTRGRVHDGAWPLCVDFFFALSGFVLCRSFLRRPVGLDRYGVKRLLRLAPMFMLTTLAMLALLGPAQWTAPEIAANGLMVQSLLGLKSINFVSWSIPFELVLPALGLFAAPRLKACPTGMLIGLLAVLLAAQAFGTVWLARDHDLPWLRAVSGLSAGGVLFLLRDRLQPRLGHGAAVALALFTAVLAVMALAGVIPMLAASFPILTAAAIWCGAEVRGLFSTTPFQALGRWSYSIYLLHIPLLTAAEALLKGHLSNGAKAALVVMTLALAATAFRFIERPLMMLGERQAARRAT